MFERSGRIVSFYQLLKLGTKLSQFELKKFIYFIKLSNVVYKLDIKYNTSLSLQSVYKEDHNQPLTKNII